MALTDSIQDCPPVLRAADGGACWSKVTARDKTIPRSAYWGFRERRRMHVTPRCYEEDMNTNLITIAAKLSDEALLAKLKCLAQGSRQATVELIAHLAVLASRKLHRAEGPGRLFGYCTEILRFSEAAACNRIKAAKAARKFPVILDLLTDGSVNLTTVRLLAPHLTAENHRTILAEATGKTKRQVAPLPEPQPLRVRVDLRPLRPFPCTRDAARVRRDPAAYWFRNQ